MFVGPTFAAGLFGVADEEDDGVGIARCVHRVGDHAAIFGRVGQFDLVFPPVVVERDLYAFGVHDVGAVADQGSDTGQRRHGLAGDAVISAQPGDIGIRSDDRDGRLGRARRDCERQDPVVLQQDERFCRGPTRERYAFRTVRSHGGRCVGDEWFLEQTGVELHGQDTLDCLVDLCLRHLALRQQVGKVAIGRPVGKIDIDPRIHGQHRRSRNVLGDFVPADHFLDREVIGHDGALVVPFAAQDIVEQPLVRMAGDAVDLVIARHDGVDGGAIDHFLEWGEEHLAQGPLRDLRRAGIGAAFRLSMACHMLERGHDLTVLQLRILARSLKPFHRCDAHFGNEIRVLAKCFLDPAPARVACDIDDWRQHLMHAARADFAGDVIVDLADEVGIPGRGETDSLRKARRIQGGQTMQRFLVRHDRDAEPGRTRPCLERVDIADAVLDRARCVLTRRTRPLEIGRPREETDAVRISLARLGGIEEIVVVLDFRLVRPGRDHLSELFLHSHARHQVCDALFDRKRRVPVQCVGHGSFDRRILRESGRGYRCGQSKGGNAAGDRQT